MPLQNFIKNHKLKVTKTTKTLTWHRKWMDIIQSNELDFILSNNQVPGETFVDPNKYGSDHNPVGFISSSSINLFQKPRSTLSQSKIQDRWKQLQDDTHLPPEMHAKTSDDPITDLKCFLSQSQSWVATHTGPSRPINTTNPPPWADTTITKLANKKRALKTKLLNQKTPITENQWDTFITLRKNLKNKNKTATYKYWASSALDKKQKSLKFHLNFQKWASAIGFTSCPSIQPLELNTDQGNLTDGPQYIQHVQDYANNLFTEQDDYITNEDEDPIAWNSWFTGIRDLTNDPNFGPQNLGLIEYQYLGRKFTKKEFRTAINHLKKGKAAGPDGHCQEFIKF